MNKFAISEGEEVENIIHLPCVYYQHISYNVNAKKPEEGFLDSLSIKHKHIISQQESNQKILKVNNNNNYKKYEKQGIE